MQFVFILVKPENSKNIGSTARALKTMGHHDLRIVGPDAAGHLNEEAIALAHGSKDILEAAQVFDSLSDAAHDCDLLIGTTARHRRTKLRYFDVDELPSLLLKKKESLKKVAIVFGGETSGLSNDDILICDIAASIPLATTNPSLNLAQAVMIFSYTLSPVKDMSIKDRRIDFMQASDFEYRSLKEGVLDLLDKIHLPKRDAVERQVLAAISRLGYDDLYLLHNIRKRIAGKIDSLEAQLHEK